MNHTLKAPPFFTRNGYDYRLIKQHPRKPLALYSQENRAGGIVAYELVMLRWRAERIINNKTLPAGIQLPNNEEFGRFGWSYHTLPGFLKQHPDWRDLIPGETP